MKFNYTIVLLVTFISQLGLWAMETPKQPETDYQQTEWKRPDYWPQNWPKPTAQDTAVAVDLDDTIIEKNSVVGLWTNIFLRGMVTTPAGLWYMARKTARDNNNVKIEGATPQMIWQGIKSNNPRLQEFIPVILQKTAESHQLKKGTPELFEDLKINGYETIYATNKDRISYDDAAELLDRESTPSAMGYTFSKAPAKVLVTMPNEQVMEQFRKFDTDDQVKTSTPGFNAVIKKMLALDETDQMRHTHVSKPDPLYYEELKELAEDKKVIFFDDKKENAVAANQPEKGMIGIKATSPQEIAMALFQLGILTKEQLLTIASKSGPNYSMYLLGAALVGAGSYAAYQKYNQNVE